MMRNLYLLVSSCLIASVLVGCAGNTIKQTDVEKEYLARIEQDDKDAMAHGGLGDIYYEKYVATKNRQYQAKAIAEYRLFLAQNPQHIGGNVALYKLLADRYLKDQDALAMQEMRDIFSRVAAFAEQGVGAPALFEAVHMIGQLKKGQDQSAVAKKLKQAIKDSPSSAAAYTLLARYYYQKNKDELAIALLERALQSSPEHVEVNQLLAAGYEVRLSASACKVEDKSSIQKAIRAYKVLAKAYPKEVIPVQELAYLYKLLGKSKLYEFQAKRATDLEYSTENRVELANALAVNGKYAEGMTLLKQIYKNESSNSHLIEELFVAAFTQQKWQEADQYWQRLVALDADADFYRSLNQYYVVFHLQGGQAAQAFLQAQGSFKDLKPWERQLQSFAKREISSAQLLEQAANACERTEAAFFAGMDSALHGDSAQAILHYQAVLDLGVKAFIEYPAAQFALRN